MSNNVSAVAAADSTAALQHFSSALAFETDCWDVHDAMSRGVADFVLYFDQSSVAGFLPGGNHGDASVERPFDLYEVHVARGVNEKQIQFSPLARNRVGQAHGGQNHNVLGIQQTQRRLGSLTA